MYEWGLDAHDNGWYSGGGSECDNCANLTCADRQREIRGGAWRDGGDTSMRAAFRNLNGGVGGYNSSDSYGLRCARTP